MLLEELAGWTAALALALATVAATTGRLTLLWGGGRGLGDAAEAETTGGEATAGDGAAAFEEEGTRAAAAAASFLASDLFVVVVVATEAVMGTAAEGESFLLSDFFGATVTAVGEEEALLVPFFSSPRSKEDTEDMKGRVLSTLARN